MTLKLLTLDATGTIFKFKRHPIEDYVSVAKSYGFHFEESTVKEQFKVVMKEMEVKYPHFGSNSNLDSIQWWAKLVQETLQRSGNHVVDGNKYKPIAFHLYKLYSTSAVYQVYPDFIDFARKFRTDCPKIRTGIISNFDKRLPNILAQLGVKPFIDFVVYSEDAGSSKPNPKIFHEALQKFENNPIGFENVLHVGDNLNKDYFGAKNVGCNALLLNRENIPTSQFPSVPDDHICSNFDDVFKKISKNM